MVYGWEGGGKVARVGQGGGDLLVERVNLFMPFCRGGRGYLRAFPTCGRRRFLCGVPACPGQDKGYRTLLFTINGVIAFNQDRDLLGVHGANLSRRIVPTGRFLGVNEVSSFAIMVKGRFNGGINRDVAQYLLRIRDQFLTAFFLLRIVRGLARERFSLVHVRNSVHRESCFINYRDQRALLYVVRDLRCRVLIPT